MRNVLLEAWRACHPGLVASQPWPWSDIDLEALGVRPCTLEDVEKAAEVADVKVPDYAYRIIDRSGEPQYHRDPEEDRRFKARMDGEMLSRVLRETLCAKYAWAVPNEEALEVAACSPLVEVGAGTGYWAALLRDLGADVVAYDRDPPGEGRNHWHEMTEDTRGVLLGLERPERGHRWSTVEQGSSAVSSRHPDRTLLLCWPPYSTSMGNRALSEYERAGGQRVIFVGERYDGCTGDEAFHRRLERGWREEQVIAVPQWWGIHDEMVVYERDAP